MCAVQQLLTMAVQLPVARLAIIWVSMTTWQDALYERRLELALCPGLEFSPWWRPRPRPQSLPAPETPVVTGIIKQ
jgi:hypothetical protein